MKITDLQSALKITRLTLTAMNNNLNTYVFEKQKYLNDLFIIHNIVIDIRNIYEINVFSVFLHK